MNYKMDNFLFPSYCAKTIMKYPVTEYVIDSTWAHFRTDDGLVISSRVYTEEDYPDVSNLFNVSGNEFEFPVGTDKIIDKAVVFCQGDLTSDNLLTVKVDNKKILFESRGVDGWFKEPISCKNDIEITFLINAYFLQDILKETNVCTLSEDGNLIEFKSDSWSHIIAIKVQ